MDIQDPDPAASAAQAPRNPGRRRFASTGIKASGVILTLASPPGMATVCRPPSGSLSGDLASRPGSQTVVCSGMSPKHWRTWTDSWPSGCYATKTDRRAATTFASIFPHGSTTLYQSGTLLEALACNNFAEDPYDLAGHMAAAYLNVKSKKINFLKVNDLKTIWYSLRVYGYYAPTAGRKWYAKEVAEYLASTEH